MNDEELTAQAADLAEQILDEISRAGHDWALIAALARQLAELVAVGPAP
jgi:hypothetical protein